MLVQNRLQLVQRLVRSFHISAVSQGSQLKKKLTTFQSKETILRQTPKQRVKLQEKSNSKRKQARQQAYSKQKAQHLVKSKYGFGNGDEPINIGPTSDEDTKVLTLTRDPRLIHRVLGTNKRQLRDSQLIMNDVKKFCKRGQLQKALFLIKISGNKASSGMNELMKHYLTVEQDVKSALDLNIWRKKWQIPPNEYTESILFSGLGKLSTPITEKTAEQVIKIVSKLISDERLNEINFNAALSALSNCNDPNYLFKCYEMRPMGVKKDSITYTQLLIGCIKFPNAIEAIRRADSVMNLVNPRFIDSQMIFHYANVWHSRKESQFSNCVLPLLANFYDISIPVDNFKIPDFVNLPTLETWEMRSKLSMDEHVLHLLLENCLKHGHYQLGVDAFNHFTKLNKKNLSSKNIITMMHLITRSNPQDCGYKGSEFYNKMEEQGTLRDGLQLLVLTYKAYERQASKKVNNSDPETAKKLVKSCVEFMKEKEHVAYTKSSKHGRFMKWQPWMFLWKVVKPCLGSLSQHDKKIIIDEFIYTMLHDGAMMNRQRGEIRSNLRFVCLEAVRLLKTFDESLTLSKEELKSIGNEPENSISPEKSKFLMKRHLLRLKRKILDVVENLENNKDSDLEDTEMPFKQICTLVLQSKVE